MTSVPIKTSKLNSVALLQNQFSSFYLYWLSTSFPANKTILGPPTTVFIPCIPHRGTELYYDTAAVHPKLWLSGRCMYHWIFQRKLEKSVLLFSPHKTNCGCAYDCSLGWHSCICGMVVHGTTVQLYLSRCSFTVLCWWWQNADQLKTWTEKEVTVVVHREEEGKEKLERKQEITTTTPPHRKEPLRRHPGEYLGNISTQHEKYVQVFLYEKMWKKSNTLKIDEMKPKLFEHRKTKRLILH